MAEDFIIVADTMSEQLYAEQDMEVRWVSNLDELPTQPMIPSVVSHQFRCTPTCTMHTFNNIIGKVVWNNYTQWCKWLRDTWCSKYPLKLNRTETQKKALLACMIGDKGVSPDLLAMAISNQNEDYNCNRVAMPGLHVDTGFAVFRFKDEILHCIAIKDGYALDSITGNVWIWDGYYHDPKKGWSSLVCVYNRTIK